MEMQIGLSSKRETVEYVNKQSGLMLLNGLP